MLHESTSKRYIFIAWFHSIQSSICNESCWFAKIPQLQFAQANVIKRTFNIYIINATNSVNHSPFAIYTQYPTIVVIHPLAFIMIIIIIIIGGVDLIHIGGLILTFCHRFNCHLNNSSITINIEMLSLSLLFLNYLCNTHWDGCVSW